MERMLSPLIMHFLGGAQIQMNRTVHSGLGMFLCRHVGIQVLSPQRRDKSNRPVPA